MSVLMRNKTRAVATAAIAMSAVAMTGGTAFATPAEQAPAVSPAPVPDRLSFDLLPGVRYTSDTSDQSVFISSPVGSLSTQGLRFEVKDSQGGTVLGTPLEAAAQANQDPNNPATSAQVYKAPPTAEPVVAPVENIDAQADFNAALGVAATQFGLAVGIGSLAGSLIGAPVGCLVGATIGAATLPAFFIASGPAGCLVGMGLGATIGPVIGAAALGIPVGIASAVQMYNTLNAPQQQAPESGSPGVTAG
ncbi:hypothetical protein [Nocardia sp. NPDC059239]|uniref:hypothetical protein n=1 Tax=unclassified Nocardia TaxID=2637762 RepID=UPI0036B987B9